VIEIKHQPLNLNFHGNRFPFLVSIKNCHVYLHNVNSKKGKLKKNRRPLILVTNDDGVNAPGIKTLIDMARKFGKVVAVAPDEGRSGMSHAITIKYPLRINKIREEKDFAFYSCTGTPADCVKLAVNQILERKPDILLSGINHGSNSSISVVYSGTMAAAIEGGLHGIPSIGISITDFSSNPDFAACALYGNKIIENTLINGMPEGVCLNVNVPKLPVEDVRGIRICRQTRGLWIEEFDKRIDPRRREYFWLTGYFDNYEPDAEDTDEWALKNRYVSVVPVKVDFSDLEAMKKLRSEYAKAKI
jgi:5'-nucleotidase